MAESTFKIRERTIILYGPVNSIFQSLGAILLEQGADVAFLYKDASRSHRFISSLMDMRQVHGHYGRAATVDCDIQSPADAKDAISRTAELFGSADIYIDGCFQTRDLTSNNDPTKLMAQECVEFFLGRGKGRFIYFQHDDSICTHNTSKPLIKQGQLLMNLVKEQAKKFSNKQITSNCVSLGYTEEFMLTHFPGKTIQQALESVKADNPMMRMTDPLDIAYVTAFLASPISSCITGQKVGACYGLNI